MLKLRYGKFNNTNMITCHFEDKNKAFLRHVTVDTLVLRNDQILLAKRAPRLLEGGKYSLIGGFLGRNETVIEGALREIKEETGYSANIVGLLRIKNRPNRPNEDRQNISFVLIAEAQNKVGEADNESTEVKWFDLDNLPNQEQFAFDHYNDIIMYLQNKNNLYPLLILEN